MPIPFLTYSTVHSGERKIIPQSHALIYADVDHRVVWKSNQQRFE